MRVAFMGGRQAGMVGLLSCLTEHDVIGVVAYDRIVRQAAMDVACVPQGSVHEPRFIDSLAGADVLLSVHGREIVPERLLKLPKHGGINLHPCLDRYPGKDPVGRWLGDEGSEISVSAHVMEAEVDTGEVLVTHRTSSNGTTRAEVYNDLYPLYARVVVEALRG